LDLDEIPVIAAGFSILSPQRRHLATLAATAPTGAGNAEPAERRYLRLPAVGAAVISGSFFTAYAHNTNCGPPNSIHAVNLAARLLDSALL
jgi:hypothetical protein